MNSKRFSLFVCAAAMLVMLWPADAAAQRGRGGRPGGHRGGGTHVSVGVGVGYGHYGYYSPFYNPFYFGVGFGWYSGYPWYPWGGGWGYPYHAYPYYYGPGYYYSGWASVRVEMKPREAQVFVDGYYAGLVNDFDGVFQRLDVSPGNHEIAVYLQGYHTYRQQMMFRPGAGYHLKAMLEPLPPGAPPEPQPQPAPGSRTRDPYARPNGYGPPERAPYGAQGEEPYGPPPGGEGRTVPLPERRQPQRPPAGQYNASDFGTLTLRVQPGDAVVTIDGERWDSPEAGSRLVVQLAGGQHRIEVQKAGYRPYSTSIEIRPGESQALNISLPPGL